METGIVTDKHIGMEDVNPPETDSRLQDDNKGTNSCPKWKGLQTDSSRNRKRDREETPTNNADNVAISLRRRAGFGTGTHIDRSSVGQPVASRRGDRVARR